MWKLRRPYRQNEAKLWNKGQARTDPIQNEEEQVLSQLFGAVLRAVLVFFVISTPSLVLGDTSRGDVEGVMLFGLIAALFVVFEYSARHPAIIEFRDAPPYYRLRILALFIRFSKWPGRGMSINMWVNLPMFDPTVGSDVPHRLKM